MIKTTVNMSVKNLKKMYDTTDNLSMDAEMQRGSGQWIGRGYEMKRSLLVNSLLNSYPIPPLYFQKTATSTNEILFSVLDGKQRLSTLFDFIDGKYPLHPETPPAKIDDETYELADKYFSDLDIECQEEILRYKFLIYCFECAEEDDEDLISEIFFRLNSGVALSGGQKSISLVDLKTAKFVKSILNDKFFSQICTFSALQRRRGDDLCALMQGMLLLDHKYGLYELQTISENDVMKYASHIRKNYSEEQKNRLYDIIDYLEKVFPEKDKLLKKINIPIVMLAADTAMGDSYDPVKNLYRVGPMYFRQWFSYFFAECYEEYKQYCSSGSIKKEKTLKRIEIMETSLVGYFELEETGKAEQDTALPKEDAPADESSLTEESVSADESVLTEEDSSPDEPPLTEEDSSPEEPAPSDDNEPLAGAGLAESDSTADETESAVIEENAGYASVAEDTASYTASDQTEFSEKSEVEEPPEELTQDTE